MKQAIAGVAPPTSSEVTVMTVWPSIAVTGLGRFLGRRYESRLGIGNIWTVGNVWKIASIPVALGLFFMLLAPGFNRRYRLTNRRLIIEKGIVPAPESSVLLDDFDAIDIEFLPGQEWFPCGEMIFRKGKIETFRLSAVPRPESFRQVCLKTQRSYTSVKNVLAHQAALAV
ncbi:MAG TPA: PH domain-containing protein [Pirellulales bacterium]|jgi:hypothetical protein